MQHDTVPFMEPVEQEMAGSNTAIGRGGCTHPHTHTHYEMCTHAPYTYTLTHNHTHTPSHTPPHMPSYTLTHTTTHTTTTHSWSSLMLLLQRSTTHWTRVAHSVFKRFPPALLTLAHCCSTQHSHGGPSHTTTLTTK